MLRWPASIWIGASALYSLCFIHPPRAPDRILRGAQRALAPGAPFAPACTSPLKVLLSLPPGGLAEPHSHMDAVHARLAEIAGRHTEGRRIDLRQVVVIELVREVGHEEVHIDGTARDAVPVHIRTDETVTVERVVGRGRGRDQHRRGVRV